MLNLLSLVLRWVLVSRLLPASALVNVMVAAGSLPFRRFVLAAVIGDALYAGAILAFGAGAGAPLGQLPTPAAIALVAVVVLAVLAYERRHRG